jgi:hypothetical protein
MRNKAGIFAVFLLLLPGAARAGNTFDGKWLTTVSCDAFRDALGFSYRFVAVVKDGNFRGLHGAEREPGYLLIEGKIADDGTTKLYATDKTGSKEYVPGRDTPRGTEYGYHIKATFNGAEVSGTRVEGRPSTLEFVKQEAH